MNAYKIAKHAEGKKIAYDGKVRLVVSVTEDGKVTFADGETIQQIAVPVRNEDNDVAVNFCRSCGATIQSEYEYCYGCNRARYSSHT
jgi:hypothetical protein